MADLRESLEPLLTATTQQFVTVDGLRLTAYGTGVLNIDRHQGDLHAADINAVRAAFAELGYDELEAWLPVQGASWLSDGVSAGVSFRIRKH